jgi:hypothetical protein
MMTTSESDWTWSRWKCQMCIYRLIVANNLETVFPNTVIVFRIYLRQLRSCMTQKRLYCLTLLSIENDLLRNIDISSVINDFVLQKSRKHEVCKASAEWNFNDKYVTPCIYVFAERGYWQLFMLFSYFSHVNNNNVNDIMNWVEFQFDHCKCS